MRTTLNLPVDLLEEARDRLRFKSKTDTIVHALREVVRRSRLEELRSVFGTVEFDVNPVSLRGKPPAASPSRRPAEARGTGARNITRPR